MDFIDLLLLHHPADNDKEAYKAMEKAVKEGKVKSIGLSNYYEKEFSEIMKIATIIFQQLYKMKHTLIIKKKQKRHILINIDFLHFKNKNH